jgi:tRNA/rRNA methyltransferase
MAKIPSLQRFRVVLVETEYEQNLGAVARAMKNFGFSELRLVNPKCEPLGFDAVKFSKHARDVLEGAKVCKSLSEATKGCKFAVGTTGVLYRHWSETFRSPVSVRELRKALVKHTEGNVALVFGNEGVGLCEEDISACDMLVTIPTNKEYPILNLSHAVSIVLYEMADLPVLGFTPAGEQEKERLVEAFSLLVERYAKLMRNPRKVKIAFRRMVGKAMLTDKECASILGVARRAVRELEDKGEPPKYA